MFAPVFGTAFGSSREQFQRLAGVVGCCFTSGKFRCGPTKLGSRLAVRRRCGPLSAEEADVDVSGGSEGCAEWNMVQGGGMGAASSFWEREK